MSRAGYRCFCIFFVLLSFVIGRDGARKRRRLILLLSVDWVPPSLRPSGACLALGTRVCFSLLTPSRAPPHRGGVSADGRRNPLGALRPRCSRAVLRGSAALPGPSPPYTHCVPAR